MPTTGWRSASRTRHGQRAKTKKPSACAGSEEDMRASQFAKLTAFVAVAEHASFTRAATQLGISNPSLSHAIRSLEDQLGVRLLNRTTRNVALTEAGAELLSAVESGAGKIREGPRCRKRIPHKARRDSARGGAPRRRRDHCPITHRALLRPE